jgi:phosphoribosylamine--glycine ligase
VRKNRGFGPQVFTNGGRVVCATALGSGLTQARERAYDALDRVVWDGKFCRRDIGLRDAPRIADSER